MSPRTIPQACKCVKEARTTHVHDLHYWLGDPLIELRAELDKYINLWFRVLQEDSHASCLLLVLLLEG